MSRESWALIQRNKNFNVHGYRRGLSFIISSLIISCLIMMLTAYIYLHQPIQSFYATNGITPPIKLNALSAPNTSSQALLDPDPPVDQVIKVIPQ